MRPNRSGCPANGKLRSAGGPCPLNYLENRDCRVRRRARLGNLSQQGCQLKRGRQRRNWRVRAVERGQRSEPAWLRAHPGLHYFEPEKPPRTQIPRNVWDTGTAGMSDGVNYNSQRNLAKRKLAPHAGHVSNFCGVKRPLFEPADVHCFQSDSSVRSMVVQGARPVWTRLELAGASHKGSFVG